MPLQSLSAPVRLQIRFGLCALAVIAAGLMLRLFGYRLGLPFFLVKYGGSVLWGSMVFLLVGTIVPNVRSRAIWISVAIALIVEFIRLVHFPALDAFRTTQFGLLLLGRVFSLWNIVAYCVGIIIAAAVMVDRRQP